MIGDLPAQASVRAQLSTDSFGELLRVAVSDDASLVIATFADGRSMFSANGAPWRSLPIGFTPTALSFIPNTHDLVISDYTQREIVLITDVIETPTAVRILAQAVHADELGLTKDGAQLVAASMRDGAAWTIQLKTGVMTSITADARIDSIIALWDGQTFLVSSPPTVSVLTVANSPESSGALHSETARQLREAPFEH